MENYSEKIRTLNNLLLLASSENIGDVLSEAFNIVHGIIDPSLKEAADDVLRRLIGIAANANIGWRIFSHPPEPDAKLSTFQIIQLIGVEFALHEFCYACERIEESAVKTWGGSTPTRFYMNSIYYYISSLFIVDSKKESHKGLPMGRTVILALHPIGIGDLILPIREIIQRQFGDVTLGEAIQKMRNKYLVHGDFSLDDYEKIIDQTSMREIAQQIKFRDLIWELFHRVLMLDLQIIAVLTSQNFDMKTIINDYFSSL